MSGTDRREAEGTRFTRVAGESRARAATADDAGASRNRGPIVAALLVVVVRLSFVLLPASPDEGGFLTVAGQWRAGGSSLYGDYWVDRPPLLIALFQVASALDGLVALRMIGCLAAAVTVLAVASATRRVAGDRAATWAAAVAAALLISPLAGSPEVNGELLAGSFVAMGIACAIRVVTPAGDGADGSWWPAVGAGACAMAAVLVKQNFIDGAVFALVTWFVALRHGQLSGRSLTRALMAAVAGRPPRSPSSRSGRSSTEPRWWASSMPCIPLESKPRRS